MTNQPSKTIWPVFHYNDARAAIEFLQNAFGFTVSLVVPSEDDPSVIEHAELRWPEGGGIMLGSANRSGNPFSQRPTGATRAYIVTDDPDQIHDRAIAAGAEIFTPLRDEDYGSRGFSVTDPEGNVWDFGTYAGQP
jgi:uncharacterized glyoxalase superfamily protein PhnB